MGGVIDGRAEFGYTAAEQKVLWAPYYHAVLNILGSTGIIIPIGDTNHGATTTCTTIGGEQVVFTYSENFNSWDTPPTYTTGPANIPVLTFNGTDEEADSPDAAYWTRADAVFSIGAWVNLTDATNSTILSKYDAGTNTREWEFGFDAADKAHLHIYDENDAQNDSIRVTANAAQTEGVWVFVVASASANGVETEMELYYDGAIEGTPSQADSGDFDICRDTASTVKLGHSNAAPVNLFDGQMAGGPLGPFFVQADLNATPDLILRLYQLGRTALNV